MGQGVYERRSLKLEQEATEHVRSKHNKFYDELVDTVVNLEKLLRGRLHDSHERSIALDELQSVLLWSKHCGETHGLK